MLDPKDVASAKKDLNGVTKSIENICELYELCSDPTRLKLFYLFKKHPDLCPSDISNILGLSMSAVSHQVRVLELSGLLEKVKMGKMICYSLSSKGKKFFDSWIKI